MSFFPPPEPYPAPRYTAASPATSAWWRDADAPHDIEYASGGSCDYLATGEVTRGDFGLYRWNMSAARGGPDPHFHRSVSESFFVLEGTVSIYDGRTWRNARAGDYCFVPEGGVHAFHNESGEPASMLILFSPGAPREKYFEGLAQRAVPGQRPTDEEMAEFFRAHDTYWL